MSDLLKIEVLLGEDNNLSDEVVVEKVGHDTTRWDYLTDHSTLAVTELPKWLQRKLAVLFLKSYTPPTEDIPDIGQRMSRNEFWVCVGGSDGNDP